MNEKPLDQPCWEPERYEFRASPPYRFELDRRDFFRALGGGIVILIGAKDAFARQESGRLEFLLLRMRKLEGLTSW